MARQVAGGIYYDLDGQLLEIKRQLRQPSGYGFDPNALKSALQLIVEGKFNGVTEKKTALAIVASTMLEASPVKKTAKCFGGKRWTYHDSDIDAWLPAEQPATDVASISTYQFATQPTFIEMARAVLKVGPDFPIEGLTILLFRHVLTLPQLEQLVEKQEAGIDVGLRTDGYANFAFVEDSEGGVSVAHVRRGGAGWDGGVLRLSFDGRWHRVYRLLVSNSDAVTL